MNKITKYLFFLLLLPFFSFSQSDSIHKVRGLPTNQIFDLKIDNRGFLWIGHDLGLSRYDGISFTNFSNPQSTSLAVGDLCEDEQGRIWCRNFSNQIFYIENEKMHLLEAYDYKNEVRYPRIVIIGGKLIASSSKGLFVCNTSTLQCSYIKCLDKNVENVTTSISEANNKIIAFGNGNWYCYDPIHNLLNKVNLENKFTSTDPSLSKLEKRDNYTLQPSGFKDTIYSFSIVGSKIIKILFNDNKLKVVGEIKTKGLMNSINSSGNDIWIHDKEESITVDGLKKISGYDLSDLVVDKENNIWYSSFKYGLLVKYQKNWELNKISGLPKEDVVTHFDVQKNIIVYGTINSNIIVHDSRLHKIIQRFASSKEEGPVEFIKAIDSSKFIIGTSLRIFLLENNYKNLKPLVPELTLKDAALGDTSIFLATATGLYEWINKPDKISKRDYQVKVILAQRCRSVAYDKKNKILLAAFKNGLIEINNNRSSSILYNGQPILATAIQNLGNKFYIATFNQGIFSLNNSIIKKIYFLDNDKIKTIFKIKAFKDTLWFLGPEFVQAFDTKTDKFLSGFVPPLPDANIFDISPFSDRIYVLTSRGLYSFNTRSLASDLRPTNYLTKVSINGIDTCLNNSVDLPFNKNNLEFFLSAPFYTNPDAIYFKYRLVGSRNDSWKVSESSERVFRFSALQPGKYTFEASAIHPQFGSAQNQISFEFIIHPPWYGTLVFKLVLLLAFSFILYIIVRMFFRARLRKQKINFEKELALQNERQRISSELHDDISSGLAGIRMLAEVTAKKIESKETQEKINKIYSFITDISLKLREVIWSLNTHTDTLENLLQYIEQQSAQLLENTNIKLLVKKEKKIPVINLSPDTRTDIYLSVKEAVYNAIKHSGTEKIRLDFIIKNHLLIISVSDDGKFISDFKPLGNGLPNMKRRMARLEGKINIINDDGTTIIFTIPLNTFT